jgi:hypothetical protein
LLGGNRNREEPRAYRDPNETTTGSGSRY